MFFFHLASPRSSTLPYACFPPLSEQKEGGKEVRIKERKKVRKKGEIRMKERKKEVRKRQIHKQKDTQQTQNTSSWSTQTKTKFNGVFRNFLIHFALFWHFVSCENIFYRQAVVVHAF